MIDTKTTIVKIVPKDKIHYYGYDTEGKAHDMKLTTLYNVYLEGGLGVVMANNKESPFNKKGEEYTYLSSDIAILRRNGGGMFWFHDRTYKPEIA